MADMESDREASHDGASIELLDSCEIEMETHKKCSKCGEILPVENFHKDSNSPDGIRTVCKNCRSQGRVETRNTEGIIREAFEAAAYRILKERLRG
jgi:hypothetical protein